MLEPLLAGLATAYFLVGFFHCCVAFAWTMDPVFRGSPGDALFVMVLGILSIPGWPILHLIAAS